MDDSVDMVAAATRMVEFFRRRRGPPSTDELRTPS